MKSKNLRRGFLKYIAFIGVASCITNSVAQTVAPIRLIVGSAAGGPSDIAARVMAEHVKAKLNRTVLVENKPGASTRLANGEVKRSAPDGVTLLFSPIGAFTVLPNLYSAKNLGYTPEDFSPVARVASFDFALAVSPNLKISNVAQLKEYLITHPDLATIANPGTGTVPNLLAMVLAKQTGVPFQHIAYKGSAPALNDLMGDHVSLMIGTPVEMLNHHKAGKLKVIGIFSEKRSSVLPDVPTLKEQGIAVAMDDFVGVWAPAGTPQPLLDNLNGAFRSALGEPSVKAELAKLGFLAAPSSPAELASAQLEGYKRWAEFIKLTGITMTD